MLPSGSSKISEIKERDYKPLSDTENLVPSKMD
jgi:hypothetical protein